jgi:hypothetical protein
MSFDKSFGTYTDSHTLYVTSGPATNDDLRSSFLKALKRVAKTLNKPSLARCQFEVNLIRDRDDNPYGFGYLYVSDPAVYHLLLGRNPDGTERVKIVDTSPPLSPIELLQHPLSEMDWVAEGQKICLQSLAPLMILDAVEWTLSQRDFLPRLRSCPPEVEAGNFVLGPAIVKEIRPGHIPHVLCSKNIPPWLKESHVHKHFRLYSSHATYPKVKIQRGRHKPCVFVEFDPASRDAQFALLMATKSVFKNPDPQSGETKVLIFAHAFKNAKNEK